MSEVSNPRRVSADEMAPGDSVFVSYKSVYNHQDIQTEINATVAEVDSEVTDDNRHLTAVRLADTNTDNGSRRRLVQASAVWRVETERGAQTGDEWMRVSQPMTVTVERNE